MKVIMLKDVARVGQKHQIKEFSDGYAQNFLIPRGLAEPATPAKMKELASKSEATRERREAEEKVFADAIEKLVGVPVVIRVKANDQGHLFRGIGAAEVAAQVGAQAGVEDMPVDAVLLEHPIKEVGETEVPIQTAAGRKTITIVVEAEQ